MFKKKVDKDAFVMMEDGKLLCMNKNAHDYILSLRAKLAEAENEKYRLKTELDIIKPVLEIKNMEPAKTAWCKNCMYVVKSQYDNRIIGCMKNCVCEDFSPKEV